MLKYDNPYFFALYYGKLIGKLSVFSEKLFLRLHRFSISIQKYSEMKFIRRIIKIALIVFFTSSIGSVVLLRFIPVYITPLMVIRSVQNISKGESPIWHHKWVSLENISHWLPQAVVASEDNLFMEHSGFDFVQIQKAIEENKTRKRPRGASTISQQTAKNVFLWPGHSFIRKGLEVYFTFLIEHIWGKKRIMEVYLNSIEMGKNIYGAEAVAREYFDITADKLSRARCALIAATLPNPIKYSSAHPSQYILKRQRQILSLMGKIEPVKFD